MMDIMWEVTCPAIHVLCNQPHHRACVDICMYEELLSVRGMQVHVQRNVLGTSRSRHVVSKAAMNGTDLPCNRARREQSI